MAYPPYPLPTDANGTNLSEGLGALFIYANTVTYSWLAIMILIATYMITAIAHYNVKGDIRAGLAVAGFLTFTVAVILRMAEFLSNEIMYIVIAVFFVSVVFLFFPKT